MPSAPDHCGVEHATTAGLQNPERCLETGEKWKTDYLYPEIRAKTQENLRQNFPFILSPNLPCLVSEGCLACTVGTTARGTRDTCHGSASAPRLSRGVVARLGLDGIGLPVGSRLVAWCCWFLQYFKGFWRSVGVFGVCLDMVGEPGQNQ